MDLELLLVFLVNGAILAVAVWIVVKWLRVRRRFTREVAAKEPLAHWRYPAGEWQSFCEAEAARIRSRDLPGVLTIFGLTAAFVMAFVWFKYDPARSYMFDPRIGMLALLALAGAILVAIVLVRAGHYLRVRDLECEVFVRRDGIFEVFRKHGELHSERKILFGEEYDLVGIALRKGQYAYLELTLRGDKRGKMQKRIPVPRGHEPQAERVVSQLSSA